MTAALAGAGIAAYLLVEYMGGSGGICLTGSGCDLIRQSAFAYPLGIPMPLFGLVFYLAAAWLVWRTLRPRAVLGVSPPLALATLAGAGLAVSIVLTGIEAFVIHAFCTWCVGQAIASLALAVTAFVPLVTGRHRWLDAGSRASGRERTLRARAAEQERSSLRRLTLASCGITLVAVVTLLAIGAASAGQPAVTASMSTSNLAPADAPRLGSGPVTVVEFADFECPACASASPILHQLASEGAITLVYRHFPLPQHLNAVPAARAAEAANAVGKFWPMHDLLFQTQQQWASLPAAQAEAFFRDLAKRIGLDATSWADAYASANAMGPIDADAAAARALDLPGTPSLYINGRTYRGALSELAIRVAIAQG
jgi:protein-disulfide isomerase